MIERFSKPWWISLASGSCLFGLLTYLILRGLGAVNDDRLVLYLLMGIATGDVLLALCLEVITPTQVTLRPGERRTATCDVADMAEVVSGFEDSSHGRVRIRDETWNARIEDQQPALLTPGTKLEVKRRDGLTLILSRPDSTD
ncbi:MAG: hypothetical protein AMJ59_24250 [Gammaproteobacteria bacterium SG8_31]|jgi:membrane protein implicated in regulation of membrane protease activity|nr:MAG: hypothetical protein AMJ59_24250 [Gammaproteobacteria bacterium SG8_31]